ncbi:MAG TPA: DUF5107 domain-containing protein [Terriglobia bacterium]|nr:DUF5107 domain-containing protein [Terriglobia bacterium]
MANCAEVHGWEGTIELPTYALGEEDPNPSFPLINRHQIYPYTMLDDLTDRREIKTYKAIYLENDYLKAIILPELGGRLYSLYDKVSKREVFYRNNVVKYGLVSLRGAWISGGIEFNFPNGHTVVTVSQVASRLLLNPDGSATAVVGGMDQVTGMHWEVALTLRPRQARLEQHVTLFNSTPQENLYWYWANAAVPATQEMQFVYPMREANPHSRTEIWTYPDWKGVDYSWYKNIRQPTSLFGLRVRRNFFGAYYHDSDFGVVHVADFHEVPGKKVWSWGVAGDGLIWTDLLTDHDGAYNEIQSGRYETQLNQEFLPPQSVESWREYWYPVHGLGGGFVEATNELAINVRFLPSRGVAPLRVEVSINPAVDVPGAKIRIGVGQKLLREVGPVNFSATTTQKFTVPVASLEEARKLLEVDVTDADSRSLLHWSAAEPIDGNKDFAPEAGVHKAPSKSDAQMTVVELFQSGVEQEKDGNPLGAAQTFEDTLKRNPQFVPALLKLAYRDCLAANFAEAHQKIDRALEANKDDPATQYAAGVIHRAAGEWAEAEKSFAVSINLKGPTAPALVQMGEISIHEGKYDEGVQRLQQAFTADPRNALAATGLAAALRLSGKTDEARKSAKHALDLMPLLPFALVEGWRITPAVASGDSTGVSWNHILGFEVANYLEVAAWYRGLGDLTSSDIVLQEAAKDFSAQSISPMVYYYMAANAWEEGRDSQASAFVAKAALASHDKVFPQRLSDAIVLKDVIAHNPEDSRAHYFLGTFLFAHDRYDGAAREWQTAKDVGLADSVLERDLGVYEWRVKKDLKQAAAYHENSIRLAPKQYRLYPELDEIYTQLGETAKRVQLFARAPVSVLDRDTVRVRRALLHIQKSEFQDALSLLADHHYKPWEGGAIVRQIFVLANLTGGKAFLAAKNPVEAERAFRRALDYPANLGVGKPANPHDEEAWYWLGIALAAQGKVSEAQDAWKTCTNEGGAAGGAAIVFAAGAMMKLGQASEGESLLVKASAEANRADATAHSLYVAGLAEDLRNRQPEAQQDFRRALELDPLLWQARFELDRNTSANQGPQNH